MSAVFGIYNLNGKPVDPKLPAKMAKAMDYWGPDGSDTFMDNEIVLGHLALHNTPESVYETMPMKSESGRYIITVTARIDNRDELFSDLSIIHKDQTKIPDGFLIQAAWEKWGEECVHHLLGTWSFAVWDKQAKRLFVARDHHGATGLYYYQSSRFFAFASSLKGLLALPDVPREPDPLHVAQVLCSWPAHGAPTMYKGIFRLPPAHRMTVDANKFKTDRYWYLENAPQIRLGVRHGIY